ncbi:sensor signal transduction histidine kinase [Novosphingobium sp. Rr 2-17]|uniref:ATP-binding protein n=1 Tax=Novosphingobium sp. Rr 2-17 TaxID=555793 RepID=UPI0002698BB1|nr:ATP-binding protein [Novosphingobium sp. Rr 2-17]EIZ79248.1 sensor signal transduction histidine kinase [Novosphingobium sp. Rr 2-17]
MALSSLHFRPRSLMGQMLLAVAAALLLVQGLSAILIYRAQLESYETGMLNSAAFRLVTQVRGSGKLPGLGRPERAPFGGPPPRGFPMEKRTDSPLRPGEQRDTGSEDRIRRILVEQSFPVSDLVIVHRTVAADAFARARVLERRQQQAQDPRPDDQMVPGPLSDHLLVVGVRSRPGSDWMVARMRSPRAINILLGPLMLQTVVIYIFLIGAVALILRRITRPLAALTARVEQFAVSPGSVGQLAPSGPEDMQRLVEAHNAMEARIVGMLHEKDVMLGAIGHDLKTPLSALRVRIESVEDDAERAKMARTIEDIVRTLDDILSLARVGRPSDPLERTELSALVSSVVEEYEDMGDPVELGDSQRLVLELRATWMRRALRNLISNALRYGDRARVSLVREGKRAVIRIEDDGPGIPEDSIQDMMNPFTRGDPSRNSSTGGAGLGLALARAIAEQHGGQLILANRRDAGGAVEGLTARLELPV